MWVFYREVTDSSSVHNAAGFQPVSYLRKLPTFILCNFSEDRRRWILWTPVFIGIGILSYFQLSFEPAAYYLLLTPLMAAVIAVVYRHSDTRYVICLIPIILITTGFNVASLRTIIISEPVLTRSVGNQFFEGKIVSLSGSAGKKRLVISDIVFEKNYIPKIKFVRVSLRTKGPDPVPGQYMRLKAVLLPPPNPVIPGGFDFQRQIFFKGIGAVGYVTKHPSLVMRNAAAFNDIRVLANAARLDIADRARKALNAETVGFAIAIMTGDKAGIKKNTLKAMRNSGLAHLLAISGLHMSLVGGLIFFTIRFILSVFPLIALSTPVKKVAAVSAMIGIGLYLLLSGISISALRAFIMAGLVFLAICLDRNAFSMRIVSIAAVVVLLFLPESILGASFQMSFAAVFALIATYESWGHRFVQGSRNGGWGVRIGYYFAGVCLTTVVATLATAPFTVFNFGQLPIYGVVANMIAVPIMALWVMPMVLATFMAIPFGLEALPLSAMSEGIDVIQQVALYVSDLPHAVLYVKSVSSMVVFASSICGVWFLLWRQKWRYFGIIGLSLIFLSFFQKPQSELVLSDNGILMGYYDGRSNIYMSASRAEKFVQRKWKTHYGIQKAKILKRDQHKPSIPVNCDPSGCLIKMGRKLIAFSETRHAIEEDCQRADIIISPIPVGYNCKRNKQVIDKFSFWEFGAYSIKVGSDGNLIITSSNQVRGNRPWVRQSRQKKGN